ncbi:MAG TPA: helicase, partial [Beijerinckiaceae bacterium]|nr:helicase [Beijerinckiaceae bacterium]
ANHTDGDIDTLSNRIAHIRTWTFAANRPDWLADPEHWQGVTRAVEDRLSDALHERLTERFVDRRTSVLMRRLRENTVLETDISKSGEVVVEGHVIGRLDGFRFTPDASTAGSEAKALAGAAQKALAGEIDVRATRLAQGADGQFVLATDGTIRWLGQPVGKLVAGEEALKPRVRIIADEHLTGAPRDSVQARLDLWLKSHIERILEALFRLAAADDITGIARGVAFQLAEALGVLDRQKVAEEVKGLDQSSRATLRKYGVRFGAYHIYVPALLKPAPRVLATQLWALKHGGSETKGFDAIQQLAASGRTSIAADPEIAKVLYLTAGYRVCGERAVRVDILERLADLIRPALAWRAGGVGIKPQGAIDGFGFTVTVGMTSLAGCSGEAFASVLRSLGYRMEKRAKPAEPVPASAPSVSADLPGLVAPAAAEIVAPVSVPADGGAEPEAAPAPAVDAEPTSNVPVDIKEPAADAAALEAIPEAPAPGEPLERASEPAPVVAAEALVGIPEGPTIALTGETEQIGEVTEAPDSSTLVQAPEAASKTDVKTDLAPTELIEVWRPGRRDDHARKPRHESGPRQRRPQRQRHTPPPAAVSDGVPVVAVAEGTPPLAAGDAGAAPDQRRDGGRHRAHPAGVERLERPERQPRPDQRPDRRVRAERPGGPEHERGQRGGGRPPPRGDRPDRDPTLRAKYIKGRGEGRDRRDREPDPNSPFAKLAALKEQLEANAKEPR